MRRILTFLAPFAVVLAGSALAQTADDVVTLAQKGASEEVMVAFVEVSGSPKALAVAEVLKLMEAKVPDKIIVALLKHQSPGAQSREEVLAAAAKSGVEAGEGSGGTVKVFTLKDGRVLIALNTIADEDEYVIKTEKGRLVKFKKSDVVSIREIEQPAGESRVAAARRSPEQLAESQQPVGVQRTTFATPLDAAPAQAASYPAVYSDSSLIWPLPTPSYHVGTFVIGRPWGAYGLYPSCWMYRRNFFATVVIPRAYPGSSGYQGHQSQPPQSSSSFGGHTAGGHTGHRNL